MDKQQHYERARILVDNRRPKDAEQELLKHLALNPNDASGFGLLATSLEMQRKHDPAIEAAKKAIALQPEDAWFHYVLADVFYSRGLMNDCRRCINEALRLDPTRPRYWGLKANVESAAGNWKETIAAAEEGLSYDGEYVHCKNLRALALARLGKKDAARLTFDEALQTNPDNALTFAYQGWTHIHMREGDAALASFSEALRIDPTMEWARQGMMAALRDTHWFFKATNSLNQVRWRLGLLFGFLASLFATVFALVEAEKNIMAWCIAAPLAILSIAIFCLCVMSNVSFSSNDRLLPALLLFDARGKYLLTEQERKSGMLAAFVMPIALTAGIVMGILDHEKKDPAPVVAPQTDSTDPAITICIFVAALILIPIAFAIRMRRATVEEERREWLINGIESFIVVGSISILGLFMLLAPNWLPAPGAGIVALALAFAWMRQRSNGTIRTLHDAVSVLVLKYWKT